MKANSYFFSFFLVLYLIFLTDIAYSYTIAVSPDILTFTSPEEKLYVINTNEFAVNFSIEGCEGSYLELHRYGSIEPKTTRSLLVRADMKNTSSISACNLDLYFSNNFFSTGISIPVKFKAMEYETSQGKPLSSLYKDLFDESSMVQMPAEAVKKSNWLLISVITVIFLIALIVIMKVF
jgi:hypothetical protein